MNTGSGKTFVAIAMILKIFDGFHMEKLTKLSDKSI
jgi:type I site-specific restriction endonuclease